MAKIYTNCWQQSTDSNTWPCDTVTLTSSYMSSAVYANSYSTHLAIVTYRILYTIVYIFCLLDWTNWMNLFNTT